MDSPSDNIVHLDDHRPRPFVQVPVRVAANTGSRPFLCHASDGKAYWCKQLDNAHGREAVINEVVASSIGECIGAPVRPWKVLDIPDDLIGAAVGDGHARYRLQGAPVFGSLALHTSDVERDAMAIDQDGNYDRFPKLIGLWLLCNAEDIQVLYDHAADMQVWSIDHGFWFGSHEFPWQLGDPTSLAGRPEIPPIRTRIADVHWDRAIANIANLQIDILDDIRNAVPTEWNVSDGELEKLVRYACDRTRFATETLRELQSAHRRR